MTIRLTSYFLPLIFLLMGMTSQSFGQVPRHPDRIRETTREILSRPEFRQFARLKTGEPARGLSDIQSGRGMPRMKSSRGLPGMEEGVGEPAGRGQGQPSHNRIRSGPKGLPEDAPDGNRWPDNRGNPEDVLDRDDLFPEAGKVEGLLDDRDRRADFERIPRPKEADNRNEPANDDLQANGENRALNNARNQDFNPGQPPRNENRKEDHRQRAGNPPREGNDEALPAPRPRERTGEDDGSRFSFREPAAGEFARFVGAMFHFMAWGILAVICGLIVWLIVKAILEYERPYAFAGSGGNGSSLFDLEPEQAPGDLPADAYLAQARQFAEQGRHREAVVQLVLGAMSRVERAGWVRYRRGMTVRDYLQAIHEYPAAYQGLRSMIRIFEPLTFGRREPRQEHFEQSLKGYEAGFGGD